MQTAQSKSKLRIVVITAVIVAVLVIIGGAVYAFMQVGSDSKKTDTSQQASTNTDKKEVTQQQLNQGMSDVNDAVDQTKKAHTAAENAVSDPSKRVKVSQ